MPAYNAIVSWRATEAPTPAETVTAWEAATTLTLRQYRSSTGWVNTSVVLPTCVLSVVVLDLPWHAFFVMLLACLIPAVYATVLSYSAGEMLSRPLVRDIAETLPDDFPFERHGLPVSKRIRVGLPTYTAATGILVATLVGDRNGSDDLVLGVVAALAIGLALSQELSVLLAAEHHRADRPGPHRAGPGAGRRPHRARPGDDQRRARRAGPRLQPDGARARGARADARRRSAPTWTRRSRR